MLHKIFYYTTISFVAAILLLSSLAAAQQPTATISSLSGKVLVALQEKPAVEAEVGVILQAGDMIELRQGASATVQLSEGSQLQLGQNTKIELADLLQTETGARQSRISLLWGRIRAFLAPGHQKQGSRFTVETPNAQVGVKFSQPDVEVIYYENTDVTVVLSYTVESLVENRLTREVKKVPQAYQGIVREEVIWIVPIYGEEGEQEETEEQESPTREPESSTQRPEPEVRSEPLNDAPLSQMRDMTKDATSSSVPMSVTTGGTAETSQNPSPGSRPRRPVNIRQPYPITINLDTE
jgi:hypothetical protein